jgi:hypothetical protein
LTCPHCQSQLKYRERAGKVCSRCNRRFAFDPRVDPLKLTDARFRHFVEHFSHNGQIAYTAEQLRVALSRNYRQRSDARRPVAGRPSPPWYELRDASPAGCLLATSLRQQLGLDAAHPFVDLGITPQQALTQRLMDVTAPVTTATLDALRGQLAAGRLNAAEFDWLERGFYSPLVAVPPATLLVRVAEAVADIEARERSVAGLRPAEVGFMTWPQ